MKLHGAFFGTWYLIDTVGDIWLRDIGFIGCIIEQQTVVATGVVHPFLEFATAQRRACRVVGIAKIYQINGMAGQRGDKVVACRARTVRNPAPRIAEELARSAAHHVGINVNGIDGVGQANGVFCAEDVAEVSRVALGAVVDKYFVDVQINAARLKIVFNDGFSQELIAVFRPVASEGLGLPHLVDGFMKCLNHCWRQRTGYVANT